MGEGSTLAPKRGVVDHDQPEVVGGLGLSRLGLRVALPWAPAIESSLSFTLSALTGALCCSIIEQN